MTGGEEEQKKGESKGFAGLSSLVSNVDTPPTLHPRGSLLPPHRVSSARHRRSLLNRRRSPVSGKRIKSLRSRHPDCLASGYWASPPSSVCSG